MADAASGDSAVSMSSFEAARKMKHDIELDRARKGREQLKSRLHGMCEKR